MKKVVNKCIVLIFFYFDFLFSIAEGIEYNQNDDAGVWAAYRVNNEDPSVQELGSVPTLPGRALCFPNFYQHRVAPFKLKEGVKKKQKKSVYMLDRNFYLLFVLAGDNWISHDYCFLARRPLPAHSQYGVRAATAKRVAFFCASR